MSSTIYGSRYRVVQELDSSGVMYAFHAEHLHIEKDVCLRVLPAAHRGIPGVTEMVRQRALDMAKGASCLPAVEDFLAEETGEIAVAETVLDGSSLVDRRHTHSQDPLGLVQVIAASLIELHAMGLCHGDLRPKSIIQKQGGQARFCAPGWISPSLLRGILSDHELIERRAFSAPEQLHSAKTSFSSDIYQLAVLTYDLLHTPVGAHDTLLERGVPIALVTALSDAIFNHPSQRPSAADFVRAAASAPRRNDQYGAPKANQDARIHRGTEREYLVTISYREPTYEEQQGREPKVYQHRIRVRAGSTEEAAATARTLFAQAQKDSGVGWIREITNISVQGPS